MESLPTKISQNIHFVDINTWRVYEHYVINKKNIMNELGLFDKDFIYIPISNSTFEERRSNLQGYKMKTMTGLSLAEVTIDYSSATLDIESQTYDVTLLAKGFEIDIWQDMQKTLNFSSTLYLRADRAWGPTIVMENGTKIAKGLVGSVTSGFAEMIVTG